MVSRLLLRVDCNHVVPLLLRKQKRKSESGYRYGGGHYLYQEWSIYFEGQSGWFYGSAHPIESNADIFIYRDLTDPTAIRDAAAFQFSTQVEPAQPGDTVFFRGLNGYYGAWRIDSIDPYNRLSGEWYFQDDGTGCFATECTPTPVETSTWGRTKALYGSR